MKSCCLATISISLTIKPFGTYLEQSMKLVSALAQAAVLLVASTSATAHFLVVHTPEMLLARSANIDMSIVFTHAFDGGPTMDLPGIQEFYAMQLKAGDEDLTRIDLMDFLEPVQWGDEDSKSAFIAQIPRNAMRSLGDYQVVVEPQPYYEAEEDIYIQQITKVILNVGGAPSNWDQTLGLDTEIQPLNKPYVNWVGGVFRGIVLSDGEPVPFAEIEVEYLNYNPNFEEREFDEDAEIEAPLPGYEYVSLRSDANGTFSIGLPEEGWWGIAALGVGPVTEHQGKEMSQDAVLWVQAKEID